MGDSIVISRFGHNCSPDEATCNRADCYVCTYDAGGECPAVRVEAVGQTVHDERPSTRPEGEE